MPPCFGLPPRIQKMSRSKAASAVAALSALVALLSLMKSVRPTGRSPPAGAAGRGTSRARRPPRPATRRGMSAHALAASAFWMLCAAAQRADAGEVGEGAERPRPGRAGNKLAPDRVPAMGARARAPRRGRPSCGRRAAGARRCRGTSRRPRRRRRGVRPRPAAPSGPRSAPWCRAGRGGPARC